LVYISVLDYCSELSGHRSIWVPPFHSIYLSSGLPRTRYVVNEVVTACKPPDPD
jgi:hypothetical protein